MYIIGRYNATTLQRYNATTLQRYNATTLQRYNATTLQRYNATRDPGRLQTRIVRSFGLVDDMSVHLTNSRVSV